MIASYHLMRHGPGRGLDAFGPGLAARELRALPGARDVRLFSPGPFHPKLGIAVFSLRRTAVLAAWDDEATLRRALRSRILRNVDEAYHLTMTPVKSFSLYGNVVPFAGASGTVADDSPVAILTYGNLRLRYFPRFLRRNVGAARHLLEQPGALLALGQADSPTCTSTFSVWRTLKDATRFAYGAGGHQPVVRPSRDERWHHTDIFTRFRIDDVRGTYEGRDPLAAALAVTA